MMRRFDPLHLLAYLILAGMFTYSQADVNREANRACTNVNELRGDLRMILEAQIGYAEQFPEETEREHRTRIATLRRAASLVRERQC